MIASLSMYARPELTEAHAHFWDLIRTNLVDAGIRVPEQLSQEMIGLEAWLRPDLALSQTCGMPYRTALHGKVTLIGTPDYGLEGCPAGYYRSAFVVRMVDVRDDLAAYQNSVFAYNEQGSQSGYAAPLNHVAGQGLTFSNRIKSGAHLKSAQMVAYGGADIAALDAVSWRLMQTYEAFAKDLRVLEWTVPTPGLPYITRSGENDALYFAAIEAAILALDERSRQALGLVGLVQIPADSYLKIPNP